jgi:hypothetical protein
MGVLVKQSLVSNQVQVLMGHLPSVLANGSSTRIAHQDLTLHKQLQGCDARFRPRKGTDCAKWENPPIALTGVTHTKSFVSVCRCHGKIGRLLGETVPTQGTQLHLQVAQSEDLRQAPALPVVAQAEVFASQLVEMAQTIQTTCHTYLHNEH